MQTDLRLKGSQSQDLEIQLAGGGGHVECSRNYELKMSADDCSPIFNLSVMSLETVCGDITPIDKGVFTRYPHLVDVSSKIYQDGGKVDLLIGTNFPTAFKETGSCYSTDQDAPIAKQTPLGWVLLGELSSDISPTRYVNHVNVINEPNIAKIFEIDNLGVKPTHACTCNDNELAESAFIEQFKKSVQFQPDGRLEMKMPWKEGHPSFPDNRPMALKRLYSLEKKLIQSEKASVYNEEIQKLVDDEFCRKLRLEEINWSKPFWLLKSFDKWHQGPEFLSQPENRWPKHENLKRSGKDDPERKPLKITAARVVDDIASQFTERTHDWNKVRRYTAIWIRFIDNCKAKIESRNCQTGTITADELQHAEKCLIK